MMSEFINTVGLLGDEVVVDSIIEKTITEFNDNVITIVGDRAFASCTMLTDADLPNVLSIGPYAFENCVAMTTINIPLVTTLGNGVFNGCSSLATITLPCATKIVCGGYGMFNECKNLKYADFPQLTTLSGWVFGQAESLRSVILRSETMCIMYNAPSIVFGGSPILSGGGYVYVPRALLSDDETKDYRRATNWSVIADQFRVLEDYTVDGTITGELDETKI